MKTRIKHRIAQLNNGEVPNGYKKTDFGIFPCDWVTDKTLKDIGFFGKGKGIPGEKIQSEGVPCVGYGDIYMKFNNFHFDKAKSFVDEETANESQPIEKGTLLFTGTGETAEEIGKCVCYTGDEVIYAGGDIITFVSKQVNPLFLAYQQYQSYSLKKKASFGQGHSVVHIQKENLEKLNVAYPPSWEEQSRIAEILMKWDEAIALYQKQIDKLNQLKEFCLSVMFPQKGETSPLVRFKGFSEPWKQYRTEDLYIERNEPGDESLKILSVSIHSGVSDDELDPIALGKHVKRIDDKNAYKHVYPGDLIFNMMRAWQGAIGVTKSEGMISPAYISAVPNEKVFPPFMNYLLRTKGIINQINSLSYGLTDFRKRLYWESFVKVKCCLPSIMEQCCITDYLENIDFLITLHKREWETIKLQRKVLQQYLLNGIVRV